MVPRLREEVVKVACSFGAFWSAAASPALLRCVVVLATALLVQAGCTQRAPLPAELAWQDYERVRSIEAQPGPHLGVALRTVRAFLLERDAAPALLRCACVEDLARWQRLDPDRAQAPRIVLPLELAEQRWLYLEQRLLEDLRERLNEKAPDEALPIEVLWKHADTIREVAGLRDASSASLLRALDALVALLAGETQASLRSELLEGARRLASAVAHQIAIEALERKDPHPAVRSALAVTFLEGCGPQGWSRLKAWCGEDPARELRSTLLAAQFALASSQRDLCDTTWLTECARANDPVTQRLAARILRSLGISVDAEFEDLDAATPRD